ncbi:MAG: hypothetical protein KDD69_02565 [Bdellovibrionales bacterium]|nr:hypothetical protein [Bdellovibrionales bacterium]
MGELPKNLDIVDPLGEIRSYAKELWRRDGAPSEKDWTDYWEKAEAMVVGGVSYGAPSGRQERTVPDVTSSPGLTAGINQSENPLLSVVASAITKELDEHEAMCLANILRTHTLTVQGVGSIEPASNEAVAAILSEVAREYPVELLQQHGTGSPDFRSIPVEARQLYWSKKIAEWSAADVALSNADRNTVYRLLDRLRSESRVLAIVG